MTWTRAGIGFGDESVWSQGSFGGVKRISEQLIEPEISDQGETVIERQSDRMGMRSLLPFLVRAAPPPVLHEGRNLAQSAVLQHRKDSHAAPRVVRYKDVFSGLIKCDV